ncbi:hypothetical protein BU15DRAFT_74620 [Melanogaster broomeanus]|nr:hypothetical protein BU15DRAFT_74620 [Melanogaster broomeanus]
MDSALTLQVLNELFLRRSPSRGRGLVADDAEDDDRKRRRNYKDLEAVHLTGCVSAILVGALIEFVSIHLLLSDEDRQDGRRARPRLVRREEPFTLPGLQRLCLRDLSCTRVPPEFLAAFGDQARSLALAQCIRLTEKRLKTFLICASAAAQIEELTLYGDATFPSPLSTEDLGELRILSVASCFTSGELTDLDLSSDPITKELSCDSKAVNVEVLTPLYTPPYTSILNMAPVVRQDPTRVCVIELSVLALGGLSGVADHPEQRKSGLIWTADLERCHPLHKEIDRLADANGNYTRGSTKANHGDIWDGGMVWCASEHGTFKWNHPSRYPEGDLLRIAGPTETTTFKGRGQGRTNANHGDINSRDGGMVWRTRQHSKSINDQMRHS